MWSARRDESMITAMLGPSCRRSSLHAVPWVAHPMVSAPLVISDRNEPLRCIPSRPRLLMTLAEPPAGEGFEPDGASEVRR